MASFWDLEEWGHSRIGSDFGFELFEQKSIVELHRIESSCMG